MKNIEFIASFGNEKQPVEIAQASGGGDHYQILINRYYHGTIAKIRGEWIAFLNGKSELTGDDISIIVDLLESH